MHDELARPWTLTDLADITHLSPSRLRQLFLTSYGLTPIGWLTHQRVRKMAQLLRETHQAVRDIAKTVGWRNQARAAQQFRKLTGLSPTEYRAKVREAAVVECFWCGQPLPIPASDGDPRVLDGDQSVHG
ncbi:helix-turn-helix transcriptional regulator [Parenemella sanctibonifatiensis]